MTNVKTPPAGRSNRAAVVAFGGGVKPHLVRCSGGRLSGAARKLYAVNHCRALGQGGGVRRFAAALAVVIAFAGPAPAIAGSTSAILGVRATVAAACGINAGQLLSTTRSRVCLSTGSSSAIPAPQPILTLTRNAAADVSMLTVRF